MPRPTLGPQLTARGDMVKRLGDVFARMQPTGWRPALLKALRLNPAASLFVVWAMPLLVATCFIVPPWTVSDEPFHMLRAVQVAHGIILGHRLTVPRADGVMATGAGGLSDPAIYEAFDPLKRVAFDAHARATTAKLHVSDAVKWQRHLAFAFFPNTEQYAPFLYLPDAAGYWLGRAFGMRVNATLLLARLCTATVFMFLSTFAIATARRTRALLLVVLMLPMSIALGASANQDGVLIPLVAVVVARLDRITAEAREPSGFELWSLACGMAIAAMARPPYASLTLLLLQMGSGRTRGRIWAAAGVACLSVLVWCGLVAAYVAVPIGDSDPVSQWHNLAQHPTLIFPIVLNTVRQCGAYSSEFVGRLAWNDRPLPDLFLALAGGALALSVAAVSTYSPRRPAWAAMAIALAACTIMIVQYFDWTPTGSARVEGVVGRYFTPLVLASGLALPLVRGAEEIRLHAANLVVFALGLMTPGVMVYHFVLRFFAT